MQQHFEMLGTPASLNDLQLFESAWQVQLPLMYKKFLLEFNACKPALNEFNTPIGGIGGFDCIRYFLGFVGTQTYLDLNERTKYTRGDMPDSWIPIAEVSCGCLVCIDCSRNDNSIYYWDYATRYASVEEYYANKKLASSFLELLAMLHAESE